MVFSSGKQIQVKKRFFGTGLFGSCQFCDQTKATVNPNGEPERIHCETASTDNILEEKPLLYMLRKHHLFLWVSLGLFVWTHREVERLKLHSGLFFFAKKSRKALKELKLNDKYFMSLLQPMAEAGEL